MPYSFEWNEEKDRFNQEKHGVSFEVAQCVFFDKQRIVVHDEKHSADEQRWFCIGKVEQQVLTIRFTYRNGIIRIIGAGKWQKWSRYYEQQNNLYG